MIGVISIGYNMLNTLLSGKSVAVVGNALSLFDKKYGDNIDAHDIVIRFNKAAPIYCDHDVSSTHGVKFDIWAFWTIGAFYNRFINTEESSQKIKDLFYSNEVVKIQSAVNGHKNLTEKFIDDTCPLDILNNLRKNFRISNEKTNPSAGICILDWVLTCDPKTVSVFGMDFKATPTFSEIDRYKEDMTGKLDTRCNHDFNLEEKYFHRHLSDRVSMFT
jgi:hypothetical protein